MSQSAETGGTSRPSKHNPADPENDGFPASTRRIDFDRSSRTTRLATNPGTKLREECVVSVDGERQARSWASATREWRDWLREAQNTASVFTEQETGDELVVPMENRFMQRRRSQLYAKLSDLERGVTAEYDDLNTVMLTFTASTRSGAGDWGRCPVNHMEDLMGSWPAVVRALRRVLDGRRFEYARMLEPHESGYAHAHVAVFVDGPVREETFAPVMEAHTRNCLAAGSEAHAVDGDAVSVRGDVSNLAAYLAAYVLPDVDEDPLAASEHIQRFNTLLWATGRRRWSVSNGAQEYMAYEGEETPTEGTYKLTHFEIREERYPNNEESDGVVMLEIDGEAGLDPPPVRG
jgi:hypothetical protein